MFSKAVLPLALLLARATSTELPFTASSSSYCKLKSSVTYTVPYDTLFTENRYTCNFSSSSPATSSTSPEPFRVPAPYDHPAGDHGSDYRVAETGAITSDEDLYNQLVQSSLSKHLIADYGCSSLEDSKPLSPIKYSNLFWQMGQLTNQSCLEPGEAVEYVEAHSRWSAEWRFTNVNRGEEKVCDWYSELANVAKALHYFCFHTLGRLDDDERSGGMEIVAFGRDKDVDQKWCMRYSKKGWKSRVFEEKCLGV